MNTVPNSVQPAIPPCPQWCVTDHASIREDLVDLRECAADAEAIPTLTHSTICAHAVRFVDLLNGTAKPAEVRLTDDTLTPANAIKLAGQLYAAASIALAWNAGGGR